MGKKWTKAETQALLQGVSVYGLKWFCENCGDSHAWPNALKGRSKHAVYAKARRLFGGGGVTRGAYSLSAILRKTGYSPCHIRRAAAALDQKWKRLSPGGAFLIYEDQYDDLVQWLGTDYWAKNHRLYRCQWCHTQKRPHRSQGLCGRCYDKYYRLLRNHGFPTSNRELRLYLRDELPGSLATEKAIRELRRNRAVPERLLRGLCAEVAL